MGPSVCSDVVFVPHSMKGANRPLGGPLPIGTVTVKVGAAPRVRELNENRRTCWEGGAGKPNELAPGQRPTGLCRAAGWARIDVRPGGL